MSLDEQKNLLDTELQDNDNPFSSFEEVNDTSRKQSKASLFLTSSVGIMATIVTTVVLIAGIVLLVIFDPFN